MSDWVEVLRVPLKHDLAALCRFLEEQGIAVWVFERDGEQCLCVPSSTDPVELERAMLLWEEGAAGIRQAHPETEQRTFLSQTVLAGWRQFPLTVMVILLAIVCYVMAATSVGWLFGGVHWLEALALQPITITRDELVITPAWPPWSEVWRLWTPALLHFSFLHILFNSVMLLELGRRLEMAQGRRRWLLVVLFTGVISNAAQFIASPEALFGGLSGVVYALIGYGWLYQRIRPYRFLVAPGLMWVALFWQILCFTGVVSMAGLGNVANSAHVAGLLAGLLLGWVAAVLDGPGSSGLPGLRA